AGCRDLPDALGHDALVMVLTLLPQLEHRLEPEHIPLGHRVSPPPHYAARPFASRWAVSSICRATAMSASRACANVTRSPIRCCRKLRTACLVWITVSNAGFVPGAYAPMFTRSSISFHVARVRTSVR